jgi:hypothetical protein
MSSSSKGKGKEVKDAKEKGPLEEKPVFQVFCGRRILSIGAGLRGALLQLRHTVVKRHLWVDQICMILIDTEPNTAEI